MSADRGSVSELERLLLELEKFETGVKISGGINGGGAGGEGGGARTTLDVCNVPVVAVFDSENI